MRRTIHIACAAILFIMSLAAVYIFFGTVDLHLSALLGAGLCFFAALWVLWGDFLQSGNRRL
jgi:uncharacterized membrane protein (GlpM family)